MTAPRGNLVPSGNRSAWPVLLLLIVAVAVGLATCSDAALQHIRMEFYFQIVTFLVT
jgi:hypothetical protein